SVLAEHLLAALVALLRLQREGGDRPGIETPQADGLAGFLAIAVAAVLDAGQRRIDLDDQLALAIARPQLQRAVGLGGGPGGEVSVLRGVLVQHLEGLPVLPDDLLLPGDPLVAEVDLVPLVHERLGLAWPVSFRQGDDLGTRSSLGVARGPHHLDLAHWWQWGATSVRCWFSLLMHGLPCCHAATVSFPH